MIPKSAKARVAALLFVACLLFVLPLKAGAIPISISPNPVSFDNTSVTPPPASFTFVTITEVDQSTGLPASGVNFIGGNYLNPTGATDQVLVFQLSVTGGTVLALELAARTLPFSVINVTSVGTIPGTGDVAISGVLLPGSLSTPQFQFAGGSVTAGQTSDFFFVSYVSGALTGVNQAMNLKIIPSVGVNFTHQVALIPEPGSLMLLGMGLGLLGTRVVRQRRR